MSCNCDPEELCEECPEWIFTMADLLMCMMGLFVLLWVLKPGGGGEGSDATAAAEAQRQTAFIATVREEFGYVPEADSNDPIDLYLLRREMERQARNGPGARGNTKLKPDGAEGPEPEVTTIRPGQHYTQGGSLTFAPGATALSDDHRRDLAQIADKLRGHRNVVLVKGHAGPDDLPDGGGGVEDLMALSIRRAEAVAAELRRQGIAADVLRVQGSGPHEPLVTRAYTADDRRLNRRVEIEATDRLVDDLRAAPVLAE